ncbi:hypothetical protein ASE12_02820 [Aeromicrobium sp. Root236]|uniref:hypothetical protein n=1 Tax=Aeromicrobium sp. Root236 TaxID=1736498 RepID=UPI0006FF62B9|nr:hypothetical protein [Aeromicrobium sp. Root236]KRC63791.1 hypothetical protein ASE12_02820 [Aeromicrobium sp. Root236]
MTDHQLIDHMETLRSRIEAWLRDLPPRERLDELGTVHETLRTMNQMVKALRRDSLVELVDEWGIARVSAALGVSEERILRLIAEPVS